jgi:hypothetical protein
MTGASLIASGRVPITTEIFGKVSLALISQNIATVCSSFQHYAIGISPIIINH